MNATDARRWAIEIDMPQQRAVKTQVNICQTAVWTMDATVENPMESNGRPLVPCLIQGVTHSLSSHRQPLSADVSQGLLEGPTRM